MSISTTSLDNLYLVFSGSAILNSIFEELVKIIRYHNTELKVNTYIADILIELHNEFVHFEVETGTGLFSKIKNFTTFTTFYNQNVVWGDVFCISHYNMD